MAGYLTSLSQFRTTTRDTGSLLLVSGPARVLLVNPTERTAIPFINFLTSATDVLIRIRPNEPRPQFFTLEFSQAQTATPPGPGRVIRWDTAAPIVMSATLPALTSMALDESTNTLFVLSLTGQIFQFQM